jgi:hypothetical protein
MLDLIGAIVAMMSIGINLVAFASALRSSLLQRITLAGIDPLLKSKWNIDDHA